SRKQATTIRTRATQNRSKRELRQQSSIWRCQATKYTSKAPTTDPATFPTPLDVGVLQEALVRLGDSSKPAGCTAWEGIASAGTRVRAITTCQYCVQIPHVS